MSKYTNVNVEDLRGLNARVFDIVNALGLGRSFWRWLITRFLALLILIRRVISGSFSFGNRFNHFVVFK